MSEEQIKKPFECGKLYRIDGRLYITDENGELQAVMEEIKDDEPTKKGNENE